MIPNYPRGVVAVTWRSRGTLCWSVYYTEPNLVGAKERLLGSIRKVTDNSYVIPQYEHPPLRSQNQAVWWLYGVSVGLHRSKKEEERP